MKPTDHEQKFTLGSRSTAVLTGLLGGGFVGFWAGVLSLQGLILIEPYVGGRGPSASIGTGILGLCFGMIGALLGSVCGAAVGLRWTTTLTDPVRSTAAWMLALSVTASILFLVTGLLWALGLRQKAQMLRVGDAYWQRQSELRDQKNAELIDDWVAGRILEIDGASVEDRLRFINSESVWAEKFPQINDDKLLPLIELIDRQDSPMTTQALMVELQNPQRSEAIRIACLKALLTTPNMDRQKCWQALDRLGPEAAFLMPSLAELLREAKYAVVWYQQFFDSGLLRTLERLGPTAAPVVPVLEAALREIEKDDQSFHLRVEQISAGKRALRVMRVRQPN